MSIVLQVVGWIVIGIGVLFAVPAVDQIQATGLSLRNPLLITTIGTAASLFVAGVVISDPLAAQGPSMLEIVARARAAQRVVRAAGKATAPLGGMEAVVSAPIVWFVPASTFDDDGWPLANGIPANERPARRQERAAAWLASEGIALAAVT